MPEWLQKHVRGKAVDMNQVLSSRIVYYPGSGDDGQPIHTFNQGQCAHVFLYVDYGVSRRELEDVLTAPGFAGYTRLDRIEISEEELIPNGWTPSLYYPEHLSGVFVRNDVTPFCFMDIYERKPRYDRSHGSKRFAVIFLFADGLATYDAIFATTLKRGPFIMVLADHRFGRNWNRFGAGGVMERIAASHGVYPDYMLVEENTKAWEGYEQVPDTDHVIGGMHQSPRYLYARKPQA